VPDAGSRIAPYTSANVGVFAPTVFTVASLQAAEAIKVLAGRMDELLKNRMLWLDLWNSTFRTISVSKNPTCPVCAHLSCYILRLRKPERNAPALDRGWKHGRGPRLPYVPGLFTEGRQAQEQSLGEHGRLRRDIYRLSLEDSYTRVLELANALNVQPPSASRMLRRLADEGLVKYEKYSIVRLTPQGAEIGAYLLNRHEILEQFLTLLGVPDVLEDAERIEHNISAAAMAGISELLAFFGSNSEALAAWKEHLSRTR
jgi:Mn-dependent DtxR family transcriptional regulator